MAIGSPALSRPEPTQGRLNAQLDDEFDDGAARRRQPEQAYVAALPPEIVACETVSLCLDVAFQPELGVLHLNWNDSAAARCSANWRLPLGTTIGGPAPTRFGIRLLRVSPDLYSLHLVWDRTGLAWSDLTRDEIDGTCLRGLLDSLGTDLDSLLDQPVCRLS